MKKIAIQGIQGAFHEQAARAYFQTEEVEIIPHLRFDELIASLMSGKTDYGVMAIENTLIGKLSKNEALIQQNPIEIQGEYSLKITLCLGALPGVKMDEIRTVYSQPEALEQCVEFFQENPKIEPVERADTALSAYKVAQLKSRQLGAIASELALEKYGLKILIRSIQDQPKNYTRFLILKKAKL